MWELYPQINKRVGPNNAIQVGENQKRIKNVTLLLETSEYGNRQQCSGAILRIQI